MADLPETRVLERYAFLRRRWPIDTNTWLTLAMQRQGDRFTIAGSYPVTEQGLLALSNDAEKYQRGADLWVSMCGFGARPAAKGRERHVSAISCLWADVDQKHLSGQDLIKLMEGLAGGALAPSQLLWSGHGVQPIWLLSQTYDLGELAAADAPEDTSQDVLFQRLAALQGQFRVTTTRWQAWLSRELGVRLDNVSNLDRVMRLPGTFNFKDRSTVPVKLLWDRDIRWDLGNLIQFLDDAGIPVEAGAGTKAGSGGGIVSKADAATAFARQGTLPEGDANSVASRLLERYVRWAEEDHDFGDGRVGHDWTGFFLAQQLNDHYVSRELAEETLIKLRAAFEGTARYRPDDPFDRRWPLAKVDSAYQYPPRGPAIIPGDPVESEEISRNTDHVNAQRLARRFGTDLRWAANGSWCVWDGQRWRVDDQQRRYTIVTLLADEIRAQAREPGATEERVKSLVKHANHLEMKGGIDRTLALAEKELATLTADLNAQPHLLNLPNGTLDLETFRLRDHGREDLLTNLCPTEYHPEAWHEDWDRFLVEVTSGDLEKSRWLQKYVGYCLTGETAEDAVLVLKGPTRTGKSTFVQTVAATLGSDYAVTVNPEVFDARGRANSEYVLDTVFGARLAVTSELSRGSSLADSFLKMLTGGEAITARPIYGAPYSFVPSCKVMMSTNYVPRSTDPAVHQRLRLFPFDHQPKVIDKSLRPLLVGSADVHRAVLAWAVEGCKLWREEGLGVPEWLVAELKRFELESDPVKQFLDEHVVVNAEVENPLAWLPVANMYLMYVAWAEENVPQPLKKRRFEQALEERGLVRGRHQNGPMCWRDTAAVLADDGMLHDGVYGTV